MTRLSVRRTTKRSECWDREALVIGNWNSPTQSLEVMTPWNLKWLHCTPAMIVLSWNCWGMAQGLAKKTLQRHKVCNKIKETKKEFRRWGIESVLEKAGRNSSGWSHPRKYNDKSKHMSWTSRMVKKGRYLKEAKVYKQMAYFKWAKQEILRPLHSHQKKKK